MNTSDRNSWCGGDCAGAPCFLTQCSDSARSWSSSTTCSNPSTSSPHWTTWISLAFDSQALLGAKMSYRLTSGINGLKIFDSSFHTCCLLGFSVSSSGKRNLFAKSIVLKISGQRSRCLGRSWTDVFSEGNVSFAFLEKSRGASGLRIIWDCTCQSCAGGSPERPIHPAHLSCNNLHQSSLLGNALFCDYQRFH